MRQNEMSVANWWKGIFIWWRFSPGTASGFTRIKVFESSKLFKKRHSLWSNFTKWTLSVNMRALETGKELADS